MPTRSTGNLLPLRQHVNWTVYDRIYTRKTLHVDAWIIQTKDDALYFVIELRAGGQQLLSTRVYRAEPGELIPFGNERPDGVERHINSQWATRNAAWLGALHDIVARFARTPVDGFTPPNSVILHYVYSDPTIIEPCEGLANYYDGPGAVTKPSPAERYVNTMSKHDRSMLRTLDKLLK